MYSSERKKLFKAQISIKAFSFNKDFTPEVVQCASTSSVAAVPGSFGYYYFCLTSTTLRKDMAGMQNA